MQAGGSGLGYKTAATILILVIIAALLFRLAFTPYAVFLSVNNGVEDAPLWSLVIVEKKPPIPGDTIVACKSLRCSILVLTGIEWREDQALAYVKSSMAAAPYPIPYNDVKYRLAAVIPPVVWAPVLAVAIAGVVYVKRLLRTMPTVEGMWTLILAWLLTTLVLAAFAAPSTPINTPETPRVELGRAEILEDYTIMVPINVEGAELEAPESCIILVPDLAYRPAPNATIQASRLLVRIQPADWYSIAATTGRIADFRVACLLELKGVNGTLSVRIPVHIEFREIIVEKTSRGALVVNPNPFPLDVSYLITYYVGDGNSMRVAERVEGNYTIEPLGDVWIGLGNYTRATGTLRIEYPWGVRYEPISIP